MYPSGSSGEVSGSYQTRKPAESRRWLKRRVPREQLYRLAPAKERRKRFGRVEYSDRVRMFVRAWWVWLVAAIALQQTSPWPYAAAAGIVAFFLYHASAETHPAVVP